MVTRPLCRAGLNARRSAVPGATFGSSVPGANLRGMDPLRTRYAPQHPVSLPLILAPLGQGRGDPTIQRVGGDWWLAMATPAGAATLMLRAVLSAVDAMAWGPGAPHAIDAVPRLLGGDDDLAGFRAERHPLIADLHRRMPGLRLTRAGRVLPFLVPTVLAQKVTGLEAKRAWRTLVLRHGDPAPGPAPRGMRIAPTPERWRRVPSWEWHRAGVGPQRSDTVMRLAAVGAGLERTAGVDAAEASRRLRTVPGIGVWTAAETVQRSHGDPDAVSVGDFHLCKRVGTALAGRRVDDDGMMELLEPWRGHRQRVVRLIEGSGIGYERHGPLFTIPEHRAR